ncbi:hypothetical protein A7982_13573 [Minicystis rosea]|nr:hypothetical protein A7982_13573 [Minicystis rosea]
MSTTSELGMHPEKLRHEGKVTTRIEERTARIPSGTYLGLAIGSMIASAAFQLAGKKTTANFIGQWVPSLLVIGMYNKLVKIEHDLLDRFDQNEGITRGSGY